MSSDKKWNQANKASAEDLYEQVDFAALKQRATLKKGLASLTLAVTGLFGGGCAAESEQPFDAAQEEVNFEFDENGNPVSKNQEEQQDKEALRAKCAAEMNFLALRVNTRVCQMD